MHMARFACVVCFAAAAASLSGCKPGTTSNSVEGAYKILSLERSGEKAPDAELDKLTPGQRTVVIKDGRIQNYIDGTMAGGTIRFDATKVPGEFEIVGDKHTEPTVLGIFKLEGDTLTLSAGTQGPPCPFSSTRQDRSKVRKADPSKTWNPVRPTEFKSDPERCSYVMVLQLMRQK